MTEDIFDRMTARGGETARGDETAGGDEKGEPVPAPSHVEEATAETTGGEAEPTPLVLRQCCQELLKFGLLEMQHKPRLYQTALSRQAEIDRLLEPFDLRVQIDDIRGLAFLRVAESVLEQGEDDEWAHPLVRRQRLTLEQSLLVAILRKRFLNHEQEAGIGAFGAEVYVDELISELQLFLGELGSDRKEWDRVTKLLEKLKAHGLVSGIDEHDKVSIRPIIAHLANPENLSALLQQYRRLLAGEESGENP